MGKGVVQNPARCAILGVKLTWAHVPIMGPRSVFPLLQRDGPVTLVLLAVFVGIPITLLVCIQDFLTPETSKFPSALQGGDNKSSHGVLNWCIDVVHMEFGKVTNTGLSEVKSWQLD
jgi:hypothetical protein